MGKIKGYDAERGIPVVINRGGCKTSGAELQKCKTTKSGKCAIAGFNLKGHCGMKIKKYHPYPRGEEPGVRPRRGGGAPVQNVPPAPEARAPVNEPQRAAVAPPAATRTNNVAATVPMNTQAAAARRAEKRPASPQKSPRPKRVAASRSSEALKKYYEKGAKLRAEREAAANKKRKASDEGTSSSAKRAKK